MKKIIFAAAILSITAPAFAVMGFLQSQHTSGSLRFCHYSNGAIVTVQSYELCPLSVN